MYGNQEEKAPRLAQGARVNTGNMRKHYWTVLTAIIHGVKRE
jgi:hypothetical protein